MTGLSSVIAILPFGLGPTELIIILAIVLIIFGPRKLPQLGKALGQGVRALKRASEGDEEEDDEEEEARPKKAKAKKKVAVDDLADDE